MRPEPTMSGWIDEVEDGLVYGRYDDDETGFVMNLLDVPEAQRVELQPGSYFTFVNGSLLLHNTIWTTKEMKDADREAKAWAEAFATAQEPLDEQFQTVLDDNRWDLYAR